MSALGLCPECNQPKLYTLTLSGESASVCLNCNAGQSRFQQLHDWYAIERAKEKARGWPSILAPEPFRPL